MTSGARLERRLGLGGAVGVGVGAMLGTGVFAAWTPALRLAGSALLVSLAIAALVAALNAWSTAALARVHPESGGAYAYGRARLGRAWGVLAGWAFVVGKVASAGAAALTIGAYVAPGQQRLVGVVAVAAVLLLDLRGVTRTAAASAALSAAVIAVLLALVVAAAVGRSGGAGGASDVGPGGELPLGPAGAVAAAGILFVAFAGYARIATLGEEVRDPARILPRAIAVSFAVVLVVYALVGSAVLLVLGGLDPERLSPAPLEEIAQIVNGSWLPPLVRIAAVLAAGGALLSLVAGVGRTLFAMGRGGDAPAALAAVSSHGVPHRAQILAAAGAGVVVLVGGIGVALALSAVSILTYYGVAHLAALRLGPGEGRPPRAVPVLGLLGCVGVVAGLVLAGNSL